MFELSVAFKYLVPRWRQISVSIISLISILVIALVVWLIVVFFSVTHGLEKNWIHKLIALTAPVRVTPTEEFYQSYYYLVDGISAESDYTLKSIGEKLATPHSDPYNPNFDQEIPEHWPLPDLDGEGNMKDPVKLAFESIQNVQSIPGIGAKEYEMTVAHLKLRLIRNHTPSHSFTLEGPETEADPLHISQGTYLGSYDAENSNLPKAMLAVSLKDVRNFLSMASVDTDFHFEDPDDSLSSVEHKVLRERLKKIFTILKIQQFKTSASGWRITTEFLPENCKLNVCALKVGKRIRTIYIPANRSGVETYLSKEYNENSKPYSAILENRQGQAMLTIEGENAVSIGEETALIVEENLLVQSQLKAETINSATQIDDVHFLTTASVQGVQLAGTAGYANLDIDKFEIASTSSLGYWLFHSTMPLFLPSDPQIGDALLLPKSYKDTGVLIGDRGHLFYQTPTISTVQEQRVPVYIAGFYDPGILPLGGKIVLANQNLVSMIRSSYPQDGNPLNNGINVRFDDLGNAELVKTLLTKTFQENGIDKYWHVETFREFEFTKDILQQLRSERNLFSLIATVIIIVACSNIVSMLIILVNDKKMEIGILRSMGASSKSIAIIFGLCGTVMGLVGSLFGILAAMITLRNLQPLIDLISRLQGFDAFNPMFYGDTLPNQLSFEALTFVMGATVLISLIAGIVPAVKACLMHPSAILRSE